mmetsp:Transcript_30039/g.36639  ORF Transcript_30039/g.36639 Transcript_30039/m.36639 type:complete len:425 (-) Transcript_30039:47-1321(-)
MAECITTSKCHDPADTQTEEGPTPKKAKIVRSDNTAGTNTENDSLSSNSETHTCESCIKSLPRASYTKKQWNKVYGGWICNNCLAEQRSLLRDAEKEAQRLDKQNRHEQKLIDQKGKADGTFDGIDAIRRCLICQVSKPRKEYSGKQWKRLFRECESCVTVRMESGEKKKRPVGQVQAELLQIVSRFCSRCGDTKAKSDFSPKQWKQPADGERMCKVCWRREENARYEHRSAIEQEEIRRENNPLLPMTKLCFTCHNFKSPEAFSSNQRKKLYGSCTECVVVVHDRRRQGILQVKKARVCSICHLEKAFEDYARGQFARIDRRCRICAAAYVKERDEHRLAEKEMEDKRRLCEERGKKSPLTKRCFGCKLFKDVDGYSGRQWNKIFATCRACFKKDERALDGVENGPEGFERGGENEYPIDEPC